MMLALPPEEAAQTVSLQWADYNARSALLDPVTGRTLILRKEEDGTHRIALVPGQTWVVCFGEFARGFVFDGMYPAPAHRREVARLDGPWGGGRLDPNVLPLTAVPPPGVLGRARLSETAVLMPDSAAVSEKHALPMGGPYLIGDFAVTPPPVESGRMQSNAVEGGYGVSPPPFSIARENTSFEGGDLVPQGYPFYAGTFALETTVTLPPPDRRARYLLTFPRGGEGATILRVIVNGLVFEPLFTPPWETDITVALRPGQNTVRIEATNNLRNLMSSPSTLIPFGLLAPPTIVER
jgi:hypothetical protein